MNYAMLKPDYHLFRFSKADIRTYFPEPLFQQVIATDAFRRLSSIHFLGSIDLLLTGSQKGVEERHTRFDHSVAVASLAKRFAQSKDVPIKEYSNIVVAGLLHDIGHAPMSHSLEPAFKNIFEIDHHLVGERILKGDVRLGVRLSQVLERHDINNFEIMALISGVGHGVGKDLFSRSINVDTIEGIIRSATYLYRKEVLLNPVSVLDAFVELGRPAQDILDEFWLMKERVYSAIIQSDKGLVADYICKRYMELNESDFKASYYFGTEKQLKKDHDALFKALEDFGRTNRIPPGLIRNGEGIAYTKRHFFIDNSIIVRNYGDLDRRYLQKKSNIRQYVKKTGGDDAHSIPAYSAGEKLL